MLQKLSIMGLPIDISAISALIIIMHTTGCLLSRVEAEYSPNFILFWRTSHESGSITLPRRLTTLIWQQFQTAADYTLLQETSKSHKSLRNVTPVILISITSSSSITAPSKCWEIRGWDKSRYTAKVQNIFSDTRMDRLYNFTIRATNPRMAPWMYNDISVF